VNITNKMVERAMAALDEQLLAHKEGNIWRDACEIARYGIVHEVLDRALNQIEKDETLGVESP